MAEQVPVPTSPVKSGRFDVLERAVWTFIQGATAAGLLVGWNALPDPLPNIPEAWVLALTPILGFALSALKGYLATKYSANGTASTLFERVAPVRTEKVIVQETASGLAVAGNAVLVDDNGEDVPVGTPVDLTGVVEHQADKQVTVDDEDPGDPVPPDGFDDGSDPALREDPPEGFYPPEHAR